MKFAQWFVVYMFFLSLIDLFCHFTGYIYLKNIEKDSDGEA